MPEIFETGDLHAVSRLAVVQVIDDVLAVTELDEIEIEFFADGIDVA